MSIAEYIRHMSVHEKITIKYPIVVDLPELEKFTNELAAIGNNLNQIARYFNLGGLLLKHGTASSQSFPAPSGWDF